MARQQPSPTVDRPPLSSCIFVAYPHGNYLKPPFLFSTINKTTAFFFFFVNNEPDRELLLASGGYGGTGIGPVYSVPHFVQRGHGIGSVLTGFWRWIKPILWSGAKTLGRESVRTGGRILADLAHNTNSDVTPRDIGALGGHRWRFCWTRVLFSILCLCQILKGGRVCSRMSTQDVIHQERTRLCFYVILSVG
jgi:hypothetical protein